MKWNVDPVWFRLGTVDVLYYTVLFLLGLGLGAVACIRLFRRLGYPARHVGLLALWCSGALVLGAHFAHLVFYEPESFVRNPVRIIQLGEGLASHGGVIGALIAIFLFCRRHGVPWVHYADPMAVSALLFGTAVRLGNFFNSELVGRPSSVPWAVVFEQAQLPEPRHPSQLYEAIICFVLWALISVLYSRHCQTWKRGTAFYLTLLLYFATRFGVEYLKDFDSVVTTPPLTMGQLLSVPFILFSGVWLWRNYGSAGRRAVSARRRT